MVKRSLNIVSLLVGLISLSQECPGISYPQDGTTDVPVDATLTWPAVEGINGYLISLGTTPGGTDIVNNRAIGQNNFYTAPVGLPENSDIYTTLSLVPFDGPPIACPGITFRTKDVTTPPPCTILIAPDDNAFNVTVVTDITWQYAATATGYKLCIGTAPGGLDILDNLYVGNVLSYRPPEDLPQGMRIYVSIKPSNENGETTICQEESFFTGPEVDHCEPVIDEMTGETMSLRPNIQFPDQVGICGSDLPYIITSQDTADGFRWYRTNSGGPETLLSEDRDLPITEPGRFRYEAYNIIIVEGRTIECTDSKLFTVVVSEIAALSAINIANLPGGREITIITSGIGDYEYALDSSEGPYQDSPVFQNVSEGSHTAYARDKNGCGTVERTVARGLTSEDFPNFFTPNGDGINDFWQYKPPPENFEKLLETIFIFDRYGGLVAQIDPESKGWDGKFKGKSLPSSDYWFTASAMNGREIRGHFSLKR
jgi:gliding motility-associated-like protein